MFSERINNGRLWIFLECTNVECGSIGRIVNIDEMVTKWKEDFYNTGYEDMGYKYWDINFFVI